MNPLLTPSPVSRRLLLAAASLASAACLHAQLTTSTINFDTPENWTQGSLAFTSYSTHKYADSSWQFDGTAVIRETASASLQDGFPFALGTHAWRLQNNTTSRFEATYNGTMTVASFGFDVRRWDGTPSPVFIVEYSTNGTDFLSTGLTIDNAYLANSSDWKTLVFNLPESDSVSPGQFKVRVGATGTTERIMIDNFQWTTGMTGPDTTAPLAASLSPTNGAVDVALDAVLAVAFNESIQAGTGNIVIKDALNNTFASIPVSDPAVVVDGNTMTINPVADFAFGGVYHVLLDAGIVTDMAGNSFEGIASPTTWSFSVIGPDLTAPSLVSTTPVNGATGVSLTANLVATFSEPIQAALTGNVIIKDASDATVATYSVNDPQVSIIGEVLTIDPDITFGLNTTYHVLIDNGAITDFSNNAFPGISSNSAWSFTTVSLPSLGASPYEQSFTGFSVSNPTLPEGWALSGPVTIFNTDPASTVWGTGVGSGLRGDADLLGYQHTGSTGILVKSLSLVNATGSTITDLTIFYTGRAARLTESRTPAYTVVVDGITVPALAYSTNSGDNQRRGASVSGLSIPVGAPFTITWTSERGGGSGSSRQIGIDEVSVSSGATPFPPLLADTVFLPETLTQTGVLMDSAVLTDNGSPLTERGFVYSVTSVNPSPEIGGTGVIKNVDPSNAVDALFGTLSGLTPETTYSVRSYAINADGTGYGPVATITTLPAGIPLVDQYTQPFNGIDSVSAVPAGWVVSSSGGVNGYAGSWGPGTSAGGILGNVSNPGVLGYQHVSASGTVTVTAFFQNQTGATLDSFYVSYLGRVERPAEGRSPAWTVRVNGTEVSELAYSTEGGIDETKTHQVTGLAIEPGASFSVTWTSDRGLTGSGSSKQIGIANFYIGLNEPTFPSNDFAAWMGGFSGMGDETGFGQDPDADGIPNGLEHYLGYAPNVPNAGPVVSVTGRTASTLTFRHTRIKSANLASDVTGGYTWSQNLATWFNDAGNDAGVAVSFGTPTVIDSTHPDYDVVEIVATVTAGSPNRLFVRLGAQQAAN